MLLANNDGLLGDVRRVVCPCAQKGGRGVKQGGEAPNP